MNTVETNFLYNKNDTEDIKLNLSNAIDYLNSLESIEKTFSDTKAFNALIYIGKCLAFELKNIKVKEFSHKKFEDFLKSTLLYLNEIKYEINFEKSLALVDAEQHTELNEKRIITLNYVLYIINIINLNSTSFSSKFALNNGVKAHFLFLSDDKFIEKNLNANLNMWTKDVSLFEYLVMNILSLSRMADESKNVWLDLDPVNLLLKIARAKETTKFDAFLAISNISDDKQIEGLTEIHSIISIIIERLKQIENDFNNDDFKRYNRQVVIDNKIVDCEVHCITQMNSTKTSIIVLLQGLYKLSVNEKIKADIYNNFDIKKSLKVLLAKGNHFEAYFTLRLIAQLSFSECITNDLLKDCDFITILDNLSKSLIDDGDEGKITINIKKIIEKINWNLSVINLKRSESCKSLEDEKNKHVMISYNTGSRELCLKIKEKLESLGYKVWIDVNDIHGSSLDAMAKAVEDSFCVLMCVTEKYRQSVNCQAEAQYAFKLNKKIIPLIMQQGYESVQGWLGIIMGDKIFVNFTKYPFDDCIRRLRKEIDSSKKAKPYFFISSVDSSSSTTQLSDMVLSNQLSQVQLQTKPDDYMIWSEVQVQDWFIKNKLNQSILSLIKPCSGALLNHYYQIKVEAPEFFYSSLKSENVDLKSIILFSFHLKELIESKKD